MQKKYAEAEPMLLQTYEWLKRDEAKMSSAAKARQMQRLKMIVQLYEATGKQEVAAEARPLIWLFIIVLGPWSSSLSGLERAETTAKMSVFFVFAPSCAKFRASTDRGKHPEFSGVFTVLRKNRHSF